MRPGTLQPACRQPAGVRLGRGVAPARSVRGSSHRTALRAGRRAAAYRRADAQRTDPPPRARTGCPAVHPHHPSGRPDQRRHELLTRSKVILDEAAAAKAAIRRVADGEAGTVRLGITPPAAPVLAPHLINLFTAEAPQVTSICSGCGCPISSTLLLPAISMWPSPAARSLNRPGSPPRCSAPNRSWPACAPAIAWPAAHDPAVGTRPRRAEHRPGGPVSAWALAQRQALDTAGIAPQDELADTDLAAIRWADQPGIDWILLIPSLAAAHTQTVILPVAPRQLVPFTLQWNPSRAHTMAVARFVHCALAADLPLPVYPARSPAPHRTRPEPRRPPPQPAAPLGRGTHRGEPDATA